MKVVFTGTDTIGARALKALVECPRHEVVFVITQPDRPRGRGRKLVEGEVKILANENLIPVLQPETIKSPEIIAAFDQYMPDIMTVVSYGEYIPKSVYNKPPKRSINLHPSLLPRWRGASPIYFALLEGDKETGVTIQYVAKKMDAGDILNQVIVPVSDDDNVESLSGKLYQPGADLLIKTLDEIEAGTQHPVAQDESESLVTYAPKLTPENQWIDWSGPAVRVRNRIRAFSPKPGARTNFRDKDFLIHSAEIMPGLADSHDAGCIIAIEKDGPAVICGENSLLITSLQPSGKNVIKGKDFINGYRPEIGEMFTGKDAGTDSE